jgi:hypothetical protein
MELGHARVPRRTGRARRRAARFSQSLFHGCSMAPIPGSSTEDQSGLCAGYSFIGETGFEPATARPPAGCATRLRHSPWSPPILRVAGVPLPPDSVRASCEHMFVFRSEANHRRCGRCGELKPESDFCWRRKHRGQRDNYCRPCRAAYKHEHYAKHRARYVANAMRRKNAIAAERAAYLVEFFRERGCSDCGELDPLVLEFDHLGDKSFDIARGVRNHSWPAVLAEIAKCDVVCANCHRRRTAIRAGSARAMAVQRRAYNYR